jgi:hypothetical protein
MAIISTGINIGILFLFISKEIQFANLTTFTILINLLIKPGSSAGGARNY